MLYVDSSAFTKRYVDTEAEHEACLTLMDQHPRWATSRLTTVETARALHRAKGPIGSVGAIGDFDADMLETVFVEVDKVTLAMAREVAYQTGAKSLDAIHIASALRIATGDAHLLTYDDRQARAARQMGLRLAR
jgi:predicted nucleic acid-binding protein